MVQNVGSSTIDSVRLAQAKKRATTSANTEMALNPEKAEEQKKLTEYKETYKKPDKLSADQIKAISDQRISSFQNMLEVMVGKQAKNFSKATFQNLSISKADQLKAQAAIADGGEWSSEAVSKRILDMAKALSGGDASKISELRNAVEKGFDAATKQWGSELPGICKETHDKIKKGFDDWEKEAKGTSSVE